MSLGRGAPFVLGGLLLALLQKSAYAQSESKPPFYDIDQESADEKKETGFSGNVTSTSFFFDESANPKLDSTGMAVLLDNASPMGRVFTDLRLKLRADHISGGKADFIADVRFRKQFERCDRLVPQAIGEPINQCLATQSGRLNGEERDIRELYVRYREKGYTLQVGRQFMTEIGAIKFDGARFEKPKNKTLSYLAFAGLYPTRGSRDYRQDYPRVIENPLDPNSTTTTRLMPAVAGAGASYRRAKLYGSVGIAGILPRGRDLSGLEEKTRILLSSNGYWQQSDKTDVYHNIIVDAASNSGAGISNISVGVNHRPSNSIHVFAQAHRVDTETLNVQTQVILDTQIDPANAMTPNAALDTRVQNNWYVQRVAQESVRIGASSAFSARRFQLTASGAVRRRPEIEVRRNDNEIIALGKAQAADINLHFVDRESIKETRISASITRSFDLGEDKENQIEALDRSKSTSVVINASREILDGKGEVELNINYLKAADQSVADCGLASTLLDCFGTSQSTTFGAGVLVFYRPDKNWFAMAMLSAASQTLITSDVVGEEPEKQPALLMRTAFVRLAYRF
ncbi:MAG: hypothetical protein JKY56_23495 [Kofleriaceae bacterium]|nr:hypothetical protein [Kofleriaceae bacterium]